MNTEYEKEFGNNLRKIRESKKMTQEVVAAKMQLGGCDITRSAVAKIEVGQRHIYVDEILLLKEIFDVNFDEMFYKTEQ
ncbi:MAG: helix-turn-helix transcriptional regulator [Clostridia bacterium]|nr:helix-turn-helix transcriptional regulator [Clostridia bacterium]